MTFTEMPEFRREALCFYLISFCKYNGISVSVGSTSVVYLNKLYHLDEFSVVSEKEYLHAILSLACKTENVFTEKARRAICTKINKSRMEQLEREIAEKIDFCFHVPSPSLRILGMTILLQEKDAFDYKEQKHTEKIHEIFSILRKVNEEKMLEITEKQKIAEKNPKERIFQEIIEKLHLILLLPKYPTYEVNNVAAAVLSLNTHQITLLKNEKKCNISSTKIKLIENDLKEFYSRFNK